MYGWLLGSWVPGSWEIGSWGPEEGIRPPEHPGWPDCKRQDRGRGNWPACEPEVLVGGAGTVILDTDGDWAVTTDPVEPDAYLVFGADGKLAIDPEASEGADVRVVGTDILVE